MSCGPIQHASTDRAESCRFEPCHGRVREHTLKSDHNMITGYGSRTHAISCVAVCVVMVMGFLLCGGCVMLCCGVRLCASVYGYVVLRCRGHATRTRTQRTYR